MRIAIIGGGIGGLTAALALRQFGFEPQVFERAPELLEVGAAIIMWPNAMRVLHRLGLAEMVRVDGGSLEEARWLNRDGQLLNRFALPRTDLPAIVLHRAHLQQVLLGALPSDSIHLGHIFESYQQNSDVIVAKFNDGTSLEFDLLVGADGLHSRVRSQLLNDGPPVDRGYIAWRGVVSFTPEPVTPASAIEIYGSGQRFGIGPLGSGKVGWWASVNQNSGVVSDSQRDPADDLTPREELLQLFDGWCEPVLELIRATPLTSLIRNAVFDRQPVRRWGEGVLTLLGDAAHPITPNLGQGGCLAIEDAAILARCLNQYVWPANGERHEAARSIAVALRKFEVLRFARTATVTRCSRMYGVVGQWDDRWAVRLRRMTLSTVPDVLTQRLLRWLFDYDAYAVSI
ncbi:MAG TPA: FAD-dependent monooxygenase [Pyrinomonadaceae bacterium]|nr:FAD-dependent monooxygenase [Pyrinomonadaceae bacterium]